MLAEYVLVLACVCDCIFILPFCINPSDHMFKTVRKDSKFLKVEGPVLERKSYRMGRRDSGLIPISCCIVGSMGKNYKLTFPKPIVFSVAFGNVAAS